VTSWLSKFYLDFPHHKVFDADLVKIKFPWRLK